MRSLASWGSGILVVRPAPDGAVRYAERARKLTSPLLAVKSEARFAECEGGKAHTSLSCPHVRILGQLQMRCQ